MIQNNHDLDTFLRGYMATISHQIILSYIPDKVKQRLKVMCQDWTKLDDSHYVVTHGELQAVDCPLCKNNVR